MVTRVLASVLVAGTLTAALPAIGGITRADAHAQSSPYRIAGRFQPGTISDADEIRAGASLFVQGVEAMHRGAANPFTGASAEAFGRLQQTFEVWLAVRGSAGSPNPGAHAANAPWVVDADGKTVFTVASAVILGSYDQRLVAAGLGPGEHWMPAAIAASPPAQPPYLAMTPAECQDEGRSFRRFLLEYADALREWVAPTNEHRMRLEAARDDLARWGQLGESGRATDADTERNVMTFRAQRYGLAYDASERATAFYARLRAAILARIDESKELLRRQLADNSDMEGLVLSSYDLQQRGGCRIEPEAEQAVQSIRDHPMRNRLRELEIRQVEDAILQGASPSPAPATSPSPVEGAPRQTGGRREALERQAGSLLGGLRSAITAPAVQSAPRELARPYKPVYAPNEPITVAYSGLPGNATDWVAVVKRGDPDATHGTWEYTGGKRDGTMAMPGGLPQGEYEVRVFFDWPTGSYNVRSRSTFSVGSRPQEGTGGVGPSSGLAGAQLGSYSPGTPIVIQYSGLPGNVYDWVNVVRRGVPDETHGTWEYTNGKRSGTMTIPAGLPAGEYEVRVFFNWSAGGYTVQSRTGFSVR